VRRFCRHARHAPLLHADISPFSLTPCRYRAPLPRLPLTLMRDAFQAPLSRRCR